MTRKRRLAPEEQKLWSKVAQSAVPLHPSKAKAPLLTETKPAQPAPPMAAALPPFDVGQKAKTAPAPEPPQAKLRMDAKTFKELSRGKVKPEARIDLHGMTVAQAHPALVGFVLRSHAEGKRLLLVITGKGSGAEDRGPIPYQRGILRRQVPQWLTQNPLSPLILQTTTASRKHGGDGALYVYLRRQR